MVLLAAVGLFYSDGRRFDNWASILAPGGTKRHWYVRDMFSNQLGMSATS
jgi:hypothetical protein